jgi:hypothetical protein
MKPASNFELETHLFHGVLLDLPDALGRYTELLGQFMQCLLLFRQPAFKEDGLATLIQAFERGIETVALVAIRVLMFQQADGSMRTSGR